MDGGSSALMWSLSRCPIYLTINTTCLALSGFALYSAMARFRSSVSVKPSTPRRGAGETG
ncbi:hypothetical protein SAMN05421799_1234 [Alicyclobacillus vulcanalis]|uniref:Uncharacterized protein n=1 Tax=Alicyclobacillus vulcanalis TaxID=252246 RepID=A0A1N7PX61_9BACL|nr:hypothetical protein SAMN05421799_1234 [Alicyclobacillus vulcanalis]